MERGRIAPLSAVDVPACLPACLPACSVLPCPALPCPPCSPPHLVLKERPTIYGGAADLTPGHQPRTLELLDATTGLGLQQAFVAKLVTALVQCPDQIALHAAPLACRVRARLMWRGSCGERVAKQEGQRITGRDQAAGTKCATRCSSTQQGCVVTPHHPPRSLPPAAVAATIISAPKTTRPTCTMPVLQTTQRREACTRFSASCSVSFVILERRACVRCR